MKTTDAIPEGLEIVRAFMPFDMANFAVAIPNVAYDDDTIATCVQDSVQSTIDEYLEGNPLLPLPQFRSTLPGVNVLLLEPFSESETALQHKIGFNGWPSIGGMLIKLEEIRVTESRHHPTPRSRKKFRLHDNTQQSLFDDDHKRIPKPHSPKHA